jgi:hypothetical protein
MVKNLTYEVLSIEKTIWSRPSIGDQKQLALLINIELFIYLFVLGSQKHKPSTPFFSFKKKIITIRNDFHYPWVIGNDAHCWFFYWQHKLTPPSRVIGEDHYHCEFFFLINIFLI